MGLGRRSRWCSGSLASRCGDQGDQAVRPATWVTGQTGDIGDTLTSVAELRGGDELGLVAAQVEAADDLRDEVDLPDAVVDFVEADVLSDEGLGQVDVGSGHLDVAAVADVADLKVAWVGGEIGRAHV